MNKSDSVKRRRQQILEQQKFGIPVRDLKIMCRDKDFLDYNRKSYKKLKST